jgi:hypothetical protein
MLLDSNSIIKCENCHSILNNIYIEDTKIIETYAQNEWICETCETINFQSAMKCKVCKKYRNFNNFSPYLPFRK